MRCRGVMLRTRNVHGDSSFVFDLRLYVCDLPVRDVCLVCPVHGGLSSAAIGTPTTSLDECIESGGGIAWSTHPAIE